MQESISVTYNKPVASYEINSCCLTIIKPGCRKVLKHRAIEGVHVDRISDVRYSLSLGSYWG